MSANNLSAGIYRLTVSVKRAVTPALIAAIVVLALSYPATAGDSEEAREELRRLLVAYSPQEFVSRALSGDAAVVGLFLAAGMDPEETNEFGETALMGASRRGHADVVEKLVSSGADTDTQMRGKDWSALMFAALYGRAEIARLLMDSGADIDAMTSHGYTILILAASKGHGDIVEALLEKDADVNARSKQGRTALMYAFEKGHIEIVKALLAAGADTRTEDEEGRSAMKFAEERGHPEVVELIEKYETKD